MSLLLALISNMNVSGMESENCDCLQAKRRRLRSMDKTRLGSMASSVCVGMN
jgi:hypothetical protein